MNALPIHKRKYQTFISHAHANKPIVDRLNNWLANVANIPVWYDSSHLPAGAKIGMYLPKAILECRSMVIVLSQASVKSGWVEEEYNAALTQRTQFDNYRIIPVRIEECDVPLFLQSTKWIDMVEEQEIGLAQYNELLAALYYDDFVLDVDFQRTKDIYVSRTWRDREAPFADTISSLFIQKGFRLIGDSEDQQGFEEGKRVESIIGSCGGFLAVLPDRGQGQTSNYMLKEIELAQKLNVPYMIVAESTVKLADDLTEKTLFLSADAVQEQQAALFNAAESLYEQWIKPPRPHYIFFGTNFDDPHRNQAIRSMIQLVTAMPCVLGDEIREEPIQKMITERISHAFMMIADISSDNLNTCIEAGIARGAGTKTYLVAAAPRHRPPFMFRDQQVWHYEDSADLLGTIHHIIFPYRRRILNYELLTRTV